MNITLTLTAAPELLTVLDKIAAALTPQPAVNGTVKKEKPTKEATPATPSAELKETTTESGETALVVETKVTVEDVRKAVQAKSSDATKPKIRALLDEFGAKNVTVLDPKHYGDFITKVNAL